MAATDLILPVVSIGKLLAYFTGKMAALPLNTGLFFSFLLPGFTDMNNDLALNEKNIRDKIHLIRGMQVMFDKDLAELYNVDTRSLNQAVKRNINRFPTNFMFRLTEREYKNLISQFVTSSSRWGGRRKIAYAFTEQGVAMLSGVLKSDTAIKISKLKTFKYK